MENRKYAIPKSQSISLRQLILLGAERTVKRTDFRRSEYIEKLVKRKIEKRKVESTKIRRRRKIEKRKVESTKIRARRKIEKRICFPRENGVMFHVTTN